MANQIKENKKTIFRRIGGRVVPITVGAGLLVGSKKYQDGFVKAHMKAHADIEKSKVFRARKFQKFNPSEMRGFESFRNRMMKKYSVPLAEAKVFGVVGDSSDGDAFLSGKFNGEEVAGINIKSRSQMAFLHELGHAESWNKKSWTWKLKTKGRTLSDFDVSPHLSWNRIISGSKPNSLKRKIWGSKTYKTAAEFYSNTIRAAGHATAIPEEMNAWKQGFRFMRTNRQKVAYTKRAAMALRTYVQYPMRRFGAIGLGAAGIGLIGYGLVKSGNTDTK